MTAATPITGSSTLTPPSPFTSRGSLAAAGGRSPGAFRPQGERTTMRFHDAFMLGALTGAMAVWLWRRPIENAFNDRTRALRTNAADHIAEIEKTIRPA